MSSLFNTTALIRHETPLPPSSLTAVSVLHDHAHYLACNPHMTKYEPIPTPTPIPSLPSPLQPALSTPESTPPSSPKWTCFRVTDVVHTLPAGLWDSDILSEYEFCRTSSGVFVRIRSPMGIVMESTWTVDEQAGTMVEEVLIKASRLLVPVLRGQCEKGWKDIHQKMLVPLMGASKEEGVDGEGHDS